MAHEEHIQGRLALNFLREFGFQAVPMETLELGDAVEHATLLIPLAPNVTMPSKHIRIFPSINDEGAGARKADLEKRRVQVCDYMLRARTLIGIRSLDYRGEMLAGLKNSLMHYTGYVDPHLAVIKKKKVRTTREERLADRRAWNYML